MPKQKFITKTIFFSIILKKNFLTVFHIPFKNNIHKYFIQAFYKTKKLLIIWKTLISPYFHDTEKIKAFFFYPSNDQSC